MFFCCAKIYLMLDDHVTLHMYLLTYAIVCFCYFYVNVWSRDSVLLQKIHNSAVSQWKHGNPENSVNVGESVFSNFFKSDPISFFLNLRDPFIYIKKERRKEGKTTALASSPTVELRKHALFLNQITVGASEISEGALSSSTSILTYHILSSPWKTKLLFKFWMENRLQQRKCASLKSCDSFLFITISENSAIINESVNTAQLISYLHHLCTLFIIMRWFASWVSRTLNWTEFWAVSGFWLAKAPLIGHRVIEINRYVSDLLQCTTLQKQSANSNTH